tara:strand:+ start:758 stop:943 length:186 start_codon:yes stop_codon:yes gene_type:complete
MIMSTNETILVRIHINLNEKLEQIIEQERKRGLNIKKPQASKQLSDRLDNIGGLKPYNPLG